MSVQDGLEQALEVVQKLIKEKKYKYFSYQSEWQARRCLEALQRALERYRSEAKRVAKYRPAH